MIHESWKILLVEDDEDDFILTRKMLSEAREGHFSLVWVKNYAQALEAVKKETPDAILLDYDLGVYTGLDVIRELMQHGERAPIIILTGRGSYTVDLEAMRAGAADYLSKSEVTGPLLERTLRYAMERRQHDDSLLANNTLLAEAKGALELRVSESARDLASAVRELLAEISERKRIQAMLEERERRLDALSNLSRLLAEARPDVQNLVETISKQIAELVGDGCIVSLLDGENQTLHTVSTAHRDAGQAEFLRELLTAEHRSANTGLRGRVIKTAEPLMINQPLSEVDDPDVKQFMPSLDIHHLLIVPLHLEREVIGTLICYRSSEGSPYSQSDQTFLLDLSHRASMAIQNARLVQALQSELVERRRIEAELAEIQNRLIDSVEFERLALAQELHDGPMQDLYGLSFQFKVLAEGLQDTQNGDGVDSFNAKLHNVIQTLRATAGELRPPSLAPFGLEKAIRSHIENFQQAQPDLDVSLDLDVDGQTLSEQMRLALYRIYQISLTNVVRHAQATRVNVHFHLNESQIILEIQDNGCGFKVPRRWIEMARQGHLGLLGAAERAEAIGGKLEVVSQPGQGTLVRVVASRGSSSPT